MDTELPETMYDYRPSIYDLNDMTMVEDEDDYDKGE